MDTFMTTQTRKQPMPMVTHSLIHSSNPGQWAHNISKSNLDKNYVRNDQWTNGMKYLFIVHDNKTTIIKIVRLVKRRIGSKCSPNQLQINISRIMLSHQHSLKLGNMWRKVS